MTASICLLLCLECIPPGLYGYSSLYLHNRMLLAGNQGHPRSAICIGRIALLLLLFPAAKIVLVLMYVCV